jgi:ribosomal protein S2
VIPGNDDAIRSCELVARVIADGIEAGRAGITEKEISRAQATVVEPDGEAAPEAESETVPEGDDEQVSQKEEPVAEEVTT